MIQMICMIVMFSMRISRDSRLIKCHRNRWRDPAYSGTEVINPATSQLRPGHTRCRKKDQSDGDPDSYLSVQATGAEVLVLVSLCIAANITFPPPEQNPAKCGDPQPRRGKLAIIAPEIAKHEIAMEIVNRRAQRQNTARSIDDEIAFDRQRDRINENRSTFRFTQTRLAEHNTRVPARTC